MASRLDRYTSAFLLSGYAFNDYKLKSHQKSVDKDVGFEVGSDDTPKHAKNSFLDPGLAMQSKNSGLDPVHILGQSDFHVPLGMRAEVGPLPAMHDNNRGVLESGLAKDSGASAGSGPSSKSASSGYVSTPTLDPILSLNPVVAAVQDKVFVHDSMITAADLPRAGPSKIVPNLGTSADLKNTQYDAIPSKKVQDSGAPSFAQVVNSLAGQDDVSLLPTPPISNNAPHASKPTMKGNYVCVKVNEQALKNRLDLCQYSLIGRIFLSKGDLPWKLSDLKFKLQSIWQLSSDWRLISLGRGFFHILLNSPEEKARVWSMGSMNLKP
ncbi:hypothetical protein TorRG33x02_349140, partial [Trema orientale]